MMALPKRQGLSDYFKRQSENFKSIVRQCEEENLFVVTCGKIPPNPAELLDRSACHKSWICLLESMILSSLTARPLAW